MAPRSGPRVDVPDAELAVLKVLWERDSATIRELTDVLYPEGDTAHYATVQKLLVRLQGRGCVDRRRKGRGTPGHERPLSTPRLHHPGRGEALVGLGHGVRVDAVPPGEIPHGGEGRARLQAPRRHLMSDPLLDLAPDRGGQRGVDPKPRHDVLVY